MQQDFDPRDLEPTLPSEEPKGRRWLPATIALVALGGFSGIVWYAYSQGANTAPSGAVPLVQADAGPLKTRPTDPGGMEVPNQDKLILNGQAVDTAAGRVERLLPPPEAPLAKPNIPPAVAVAAQPAPQVATAVPPALNAPRSQAAAPVAQPAPSAQVAAAPRAAVQTVPTAPQPVVARPASPPPASATQTPIAAATKPQVPATAAPSVTPAAAGRGGKVQLGAVKSEAAAAAEWGKLQKAHPELAALSMSIAKVDIPNKGTYYRIQAGPTADAAAVCGAVKARGQDCLVVR